MFPTARQILPLHSGFSDEESTEDELPYVPTISSDNPSQSEEKTAEITPANENRDTGQASINIMVKEADIITCDYKLVLRELNEDEINLWTKKDVLPEFPDFVAGRNVGGHNIQPKASPTRHNTRPLWSNSSVNYEDLDDSSDTPSPKRPPKKTQTVKKDGPSADRIAAREYSLRN